MGLAATALTLVALSPAQAASNEVEVAYVADATSASVGCFGSPACAAQPDGSFYVTPAGRSFTLNVDDLGTMDGDHVWISVRGNGIDVASCVPVRTTRSFTGLHAGAHVLVIIRALGVPCPATAGVVTVTGAAI